MECPYCYCRVKDMPEHLKKSERCKEKHEQRLTKQFRHAEARKVRRNIYKEKK